MPLQAIFHALEEVGLNITNGQNINIFHSPIYPVVHATTSFGSSMTTFQQLNRSATTLLSNPIDCNLTSLLLLEFCPRYCPATYVHLLFSTDKHMFQVKPFRCNIKFSESSYLIITIGNQQFPGNTSQTQPHVSCNSYILQQQLVVLFTILPGLFTNFCDAAFFSCRF